jgi:hypothetical protein
MSLIQRMVAVFVRPTSAWAGLEHQVQWWFPVLIVVAVNATSVAVLHERALLPMLLDQWEQAVDQGRMSGEQLAQMEQMFSGGAGRVFLLVQQIIVIPVLLLITGLLLSFGCGFLLGHKLSFRLGLEVASWSALVTIPTVLLTSVLAWQRETYEGIHLGFGVLLAGLETNRWTTIVSGVLDALGPLALWNLALMILGASALSGTNRKAATWTLGAIYLVVVLAFSVLGAVMGRSGG